MNNEVVGLDRMTCKTVMTFQEQTDWFKEHRLMKDAKQSLLEVVERAFGNSIESACDIANGDKVEIGVTRVLEMFFTMVIDDLGDVKEDYCA